MGFHEELEAAIECLTEFTNLNIESLIEDGVMTKSDVIDTFRRAKERGVVGKDNRIIRINSPKL